MNGARLIVKSNTLIETPNPLTVFEHRLVACVLSLIEPNETMLKPLKIYIPDFRRLIGITQGYNNQLIQDHLNGFLTKPYPVRWLESAQIDFENSQITIQLNTNLTPYLLQLSSNFTHYPLNYVIQFQNKYAFKVYELLKQYEKFGFRLMELEKLRYWLGIGTDEYLVFKNFRNRVLIPVKEEINTKTDITISFSLITQGRRVIGLKFIVRRPSKKCQKNDEINALLEMVPREHREKQTIGDILLRYSKHYGEDYLKRNIRYATKHSKGNYRAYLAQALENDWGLGLAEDEMALQRKKDDQSRLDREIKAAREQECLEQEKKKQEALAKFYSLSKDEQLEIEEKIDRGNQFFRHLPRETKIWIWMEENFLDQKNST